VDIVVIRGALRTGAAPPSAVLAAVLREPALDLQPEPVGSPLEDALRVFEHAVRRHAMAEREVAVSRRPSSLKAVLKTSAALSRARADLLLELTPEATKVVGGGDQAPPLLRLCP
jgi:hypothetical protein